MGCILSRFKTPERTAAIVAELCERCDAFGEHGVKYCGACGHLNVLCHECMQPWISRHDPAPECTVCAYPMWEAPLQRKRA